jgi:hypothetical protein
MHMVGPLEKFKSHGNSSRLAAALELAPPRSIFLLDPYGTTGNY